MWWWVVVVVVVKGEGKTFFFFFLQEEKSVHAISFSFFFSLLFFKSLFFSFFFFSLSFFFYLVIIYLFYIFCVFCLLFCFFNSTDIFDTREILLRSGNCNIFGRFFVWTYSTCVELYQQACTCRRGCATHLICGRRHYRSKNALDFSCVLLESCVDLELGRCRKNEAVVQSIPHALCSFLSIRSRAQFLIWLKQQTKKNVR